MSGKRCGFRTDLGLASARSCWESMSCCSPVIPLVAIPCGIWPVASWTNFRNHQHVIALTRVSLVSTDATCSGRGSAYSGSALLIFTCACVRQVFGQIGESSDMATVFVAFRTLCYMAAFILFFGWLASRIQPWDESLKIPLPSWSTIIGLVAGTI